MGKLIRRLAGIVGIVLLSFLALPQPAQACYACEPVWTCTYFGGFWCAFVTVCRDQGIPCSDCYPGCIDGYDFCDNFGPPCQFASKSPESTPNRLADATPFALPVAR